MTTHLEALMKNTPLQYGFLELHGSGKESYSAYVSNKGTDRNAAVNEAVDLALARDKDLKCGNKVEVFLDGDYILFLGDGNVKDVDLAGIFTGVSRRQAHPEKYISLAVQPNETDTAFRARIHAEYAQGTQGSSPVTPNAPSPGAPAPKPR